MTPVHGQINPAATTYTDIYECSTGMKAKGRIRICEAGGGTPTYRVALIPSGESLSTEHYLTYDKAMTANGIDSISEIYLNSGDKLQAYASSSAVAFSFNGYETET